MRIDRVEFSVKVDLTGTPDREGPYRFRPAFAVISDHGHNAVVYGNRVDGKGQAYKVRSTVWYESPRDWPEYVRQAVRLARDFEAEAMNAWEVRA